MKTTSEEDVRSLVRMINTARGPEALTEAELDEVFAVRWPEFRDRFDAINASAEGQPAAHRSNTDQSVPDLSAMMGEMQKILRGIAAGDVAVRTRSRGVADLPRVRPGGASMAQQILEAAQKRSSQLGDQWLSSLALIGKKGHPIAARLIDAVPFPKPVREENGVLRLTISLRCSDSEYRELLAEVPAFNDLLTAIALHDSGGRRVELEIKQLPLLPSDVADIEAIADDSKRPVTGGDFLMPD